MFHFVTLAACSVQGFVGYKARSGECVESSHRPGQSHTARDIARKHCCIDPVMGSESQGTMLPPQCVLYTGGWSHKAARAWREMGRGGESATRLRACPYGAYNELKETRGAQHFGVGRCTAALADKYSLLRAVKAPANSTGSRFRLYRPGSIRHSTRKPTKCLGKSQIPQ